MRSIFPFFIAILFAATISAQNIKFTLYNQANTPAFTTNSFKQVAVGKDNNIWVLL